MRTTSLTCAEVAGFVRTLPVGVYSARRPGCLRSLVSLRNRTAGREDGKTLVCDKRDRAINCVLYRDPLVTTMFSGICKKTSV